MKLCIEGDIYFIPKFHILETGTVKLSIETGLMLSAFSNLTGPFVLMIANLLMVWRESCFVAC
jgi:hypothetical protein